MPIIARPVPQNISALNPNAFLFSIQKFPELTFFVQEAPLPEISLGQALQSSSVHDIKTPGETMEYGDLTIQFLVDETMDNYIAIHDWIVGLGFPQGHKQFRDYINSTRNAQGYPASTAQKTVSDCFLTILNSDNIAMTRFEFVDAFPTNLSGLTFQTTNSDVQYLVASLTLAYSYYTITRVELPGTRNGVWLGLDGNNSTGSVGGIIAVPDRVDVSLRGAFIRTGLGEFECISTAPGSALSHNITIGIEGVTGSGVV